MTGAQPPVKLRAMPKTNISRPEQPSAATFHDRVRVATELLESVVSDRGLLLQIDPGDRQRLLQAAGHVYAPDAAARRQLVRASSRRRKAEKVEQENRVLNQTGIRTLRRQTVYTSPNVFPPVPFEQREVADPEFREAVEPQHCYVCKQKYTTIHHFYDQMCPPCAAFNFAKRTELADLRGRVALLTGGRVKIGYQAGIKLLRAGAHLIVTTRFPRDSAVRYAAEPDFADWGHRLEIFGLDLRHTPSVEAFCRELLTTRDRLDFIVNNACQTVRRPPGFYEHMMARETAALHAMPEPTRRLLGTYEGWRGAHLHFDGPQAATPAAFERRLPSIAGLANSAELSQVPLLPRSTGLSGITFPRGCSIRTSSRWTSGSGTRGGCCWPTCRRSSCWRYSWSTPWPRLS